MANNFRFREEQRSSPIMIGLLCGLAVIEAGLSFYFWRAIAQVGWLHAAASALFVLSAFLFRKLTITVSDDLVTFGFGPFKRRIARHAIRTTQIVEASLRTTGIGIHIVSGGYHAWVAKNGPAVLIVVTHGKVPGYIISTDRPRDLIAALNSKAEEPAKA